MSRAVLVVVLLVSAVLSGCRGPGDVTDPSGDRVVTRRIGEYAGYLAMRAASRERAALLVRALADALRGSVGTVDGDWEGCARRGEETYAFTYGVTAVVDDTRVRDVLPLVGLVLRTQGWTIIEPPGHGGGPLVAAAYDGIAVVVDEGIPADRLVVQTSSGCFRVPEEHRRVLRHHLDDAPIQVPPPAPPLRRPPG